MKQIKVKNGRKINFKNFIYRERGASGEYLQTDPNKKYKKPIVQIQQSISKGRSKIEQKAKRDTYSASDYKYNDLKSKITNSSDRTIKSYIKKPYVDPTTGFTKTHDELAPQVEMSGRDPLLGTIVDLYTGNKFINAGFKTANYFADKFANVLAKRFLYNTAEPTVRYATPEELAIFNGTIQKSNNESLIQPFSRTINANTKQIGQVTKQLEKKNQGQFLLPILKPKATLKPITNDVIQTGIESPYINILEKAVDNSQIVRPDGSINPKMLIRGLQELKSANPNAASYKNVFNKGPLKQGFTNLAQHTKGVVETAQQIPVPTGYTRQDLVQSALFHDIGKVYDPTQGVHEKISADMLQKALNSKNGIMPVQRINNEVLDAIKNHGHSHHMMDLSPLTQALHLADVSRGLSYDQSALTYPQLLTYPREFPQFSFPQLPLRDELKTVINPWLRRYGYETINLNATREQAEQQLENIISQHNTWVRSVKGARNQTEAQNWVERIPRENNGGRRGFLGLRGRYGVGEKYDASYMSTSSSIADLYGDDKGRFVVELPRTEKSLTSPSLSERLLAGDYEMYNAQGVGRDYSPIGSFSMLEGPYRLQTGRSLLQDMQKDGFLKVEKQDPKRQLSFLQDNTSINLSGGKSETNQDLLNKVNKVFRDNGFKEIKPLFEEYDEFGTMLSPGMVPSDALRQLAKQIGVIDNINNYSKIYESLRPDINKLQDLRKSVYKLKINLGKAKDKINKFVRDHESEKKYNTAYPFFDEIYFDNPVLDREYTKLNNELMNITRDFNTRANEFSSLNYQIDNKINIPFIHLQGLVSPKQMNAFNITKDPKYLDVKHILSGIKKQYFETYNKFYKPKIRIEKPTQEKMLEYMREKNIHPRFEYETFNHIRTLTPNQHEGDAVQKMATINKPLGESQIALIGKKNQKMLTVKKPISREQIYKEVIKTKRNRKYKDYGPRIKSVKLSRKTLQ